MSICCGDACGLDDGELAGIFIPGMWVCVCCGDACGFGDGELAGIFIPGMWVCVRCGNAGGFGDVELAGIFIPGVCLFAGGFLGATRFRPRAGTFLLDFALAFGLGLALLMPGILDMSWPSCWANAT